MVDYGAHDEGLKGEISFGHGSFTKSDILKSIASYVEIFKAFKHLRLPNELLVR